MSGYEQYSALQIEGPDELGIITIYLIGPGLHAIGHDAHRELVEIWQDIGKDERVRVVIIRGEGERAYSAGGSFDVVEDMIADFDVRARVYREARELVRNLIECPVPVIAAINGPAAGAGLVTAALADITIAGRNAKIIDGHVRLGVAAGDHAAVAWPLLTSMAKAKYYLLTNEVLRGEEAERIGMVSRVVDDELVQQTAREVAEKLAAGSKPALSATKHSLNHWYRQSFPIFEASLGYEFFGFGGPDVREGVASHREKRNPKFS
ncbi:enoyl-CoA hydratase/isomerase family protein [Arthrobacter bambusae]|uniref:enoyl-CoA hydratase/isomerase family protein n=1 Tax=Arthrobacter bambusae TaxID=1338426 RepID=UPI001F505F0B|nr:enoyl-CoA hydratase/isomerase family protein [Arthrobacter bambusae]MCI0142619.1 enoyl-CoA hydratase/isomerase family protein [Arthrobacter bambusae]